MNEIDESALSRAVNEAINGSDDDVDWVYVTELLRQVWGILNDETPPQSFPGERDDAGVTHEAHAARFVAGIFAWLETLVLDGDEDFIVDVVNIYAQTACTAINYGEPNRHGVYAGALPSMMFEHLYAHHNPRLFNHSQGHCLEGETPQ